MIMAYGYMRPDPVEQFRGAVGHYKLLIAVAIEEGFTRAEAIELINIWQLAGISSGIDAISF